MRKPCSRTRRISLLAAFCAFAVSAAQAQIRPTAPVTVTPETFVRANTDRSFDEIAKLAGGVNRLFHYRNAIPLDKQIGPRMNKDALLSAAIVDTSSGATISLPKLPDSRSMAVLMVDNNRYVAGVQYYPGTHRLPRDTKHLLVVVRIQLHDPSDQAEAAMINKWQDQIVIRAGSADPLPAIKWDRASLDALQAKYQAESARYGSFGGMEASQLRGDQISRNVATAMAMGTTPNWDITQLNYDGGHDFKVCHRATYRVPETRDFWSITVYGNDGYMKSLNNVLNSSHVKLNADGTFTAHFGSEEACGKVPNRLDVTEGWTYLMRIYRPGSSVLDGSYKLPRAEPVR